MSARRSVGLILGFIGILLVNLKGQTLDFHMTFAGEGFVLLAVLSSTLAMVVLGVVCPGMVLTARE